MSTFDESKIRRDGEGKFASKGPAAEASGVELRANASLNRYVGDRTGALHHAYWAHDLAEASNGPDESYAAAIDEAAATAYGAFHGTLCSELDSEWPDDVPEDVRERWRTDVDSDEAYRGPLTGE